VGASGSTLESPSKALSVDVSETEPSPSSVFVGAPSDAPFGAPFDALHAAPNPTAPAHAKVTTAKRTIDFSMLICS
jgi:hypothetical protein